MSLGGVRDEAEIRGHRRTYIGSMPGKIIQNLGKVGVRNPLFLLDEVDKMAMDFRGDPSSALLEVLDPEQNATFQDHYLEVDFDLSEVMFVCTANSLNIPAPLLDRMEVIRIPGYTEDEKLNIAIRYLIPKQMKENGLEGHELHITKAPCSTSFSTTRASRACETWSARSPRFVAKSSSAAAEAENGTRHGDAESLEKYLGVRRFRYGKAEENDQVGQVTGLAWTEVGGELLTIEAAVVAGQGQADAHRQARRSDDRSRSRRRMTIVRSRAELGIDPDFHQKYDVHVHVPEGATPKDGPSAGVAHVHRTGVGIDGSAGEQRRRDDR